MKKKQKTQDVLDNILLGPPQVASTVSSGRDFVASFTAIFGAYKKPTRRFAHVLTSPKVYKGVRGRVYQQRGDGKIHLCFTLIAAAKTSYY